MHKALSSGEKGRKRIRTILTCIIRVYSVGESAGCLETSGYAPAQLIGQNVAFLCPLSVGKQHPGFMRLYNSSVSTVIGHTRNRELRTAEGACIPIALEVTEVSRDPLIFGATITEVPCNRSGRITTDPRGKITSCDENCAIIFGYETEELIGRPIGLLSPHIKVNSKPENQLLCRHRDGSNLFVKIRVEKMDATGYR